MFKFTQYMAALTLATFSTYAAAELPIKIKQGQSYKQARKILLNSGWQTVNMNQMPNGTPLCYTFFEGDGEEDCEGYYEIDSCSGTGMGYCSMYFFDGDKTYLRVLTNGGTPIGNNGWAEIHSWSKVYEHPEINIPDDNLLEERMNRSK